MLTIQNQHVDSAPTFDLTNARFVSYFEGSCGDQWVCIWHADQPEAFFYGGDCGWEPMTYRKIATKVVLGRAEAAWVVACSLSLADLYTYNQHKQETP